jgi:type II secretory pathway component PulK
MRKSLSQNEQGSLLIGVLALTMFMAVMITALSALANANLQRSKSRILVLQAQYSAESGADAAIATLNNDLSTTYTGTGGSQVTVLTTSRYKATYSTTVVSGSNQNELIITSIGRVFQPVTASSPLYT